MENKSVSETLADQIYDAQLSELEKRNACQDVLRRTCSYLESIHKAIISETSSQDGDQHNVTFDSSLYSAVMVLVDLLTLEGIYPSLPQGVVSPPERRKKSLLYTKVPPQAALSEDLQFSNHILRHTFNPILLDKQQGVQPFLRERIISDIVIGNANLAFLLDCRIYERTYFAESLHQILDSLPTQTVYRLLTPFIKQSVPERLRSPLAEIVALLPTRTNGVRHTINFIASSYPAPIDTKADKDVRPSQGPPLHMEALDQMAKVLSSIPKNTTPEAYLPLIVEQLLDLLDGEGGSELGRAAGYIIASGILGKRSVGAPGSIGWKLIAEPILNAINPPESIQAQSSRTQTGDVHDNLGTELVSQAVFDQALNRLVTIISSHPSPGLMARLLRPLLLPLWGLANYSESPIAHSFYKQTASKLLEAYFSLYGNLQQLQLLAANVAGPRTMGWAFASGSEGGIAIRKKEGDTDGAKDLISQLGRIDIGISTLINLLERSNVGDAVISSLLLDLTKRWLQNPTQQNQSIGTAGEEDPLQSLAFGKLAQAILDKFQNRILKDPSQLLCLLEQVLQEEVQLRRLELERTHNLTRPTISSLSSIVANENNLSPTNGENEVSGLLIDRNNVLQIVVGLINIILTGSEESLINKAPVTTTINSIHSLLRILTQGPSRTLDNSLEASIDATLSLIEFATSPSIAAQPSTPSVATTTTPNSTLTTLTKIQTDLQSDLPPIRISALRTLSELINTLTVTLDIASTTVLLLRTIRTDNDEYVSIAAIRVIVELARKRNLRFVTAILCDAFQDPMEESGVDGRLRVGEALSNLVDGAADKFGDGKEVDVTTWGNTLRAVAEICVVVAGRRGKRRREMEERNRKERLDKKRKRKAEKMWGGEIPVLPTGQEEDEEEEMTEEQKARKERKMEAIEKIVRGWEDTGLEEDVRIRASAVSVLGHVLEVGLERLPVKFVDDAVDLVLNILVMEQEPSKAILRRASVLAVFSLLKALNALHEEENASSVNLESQKWSAVERVLRWIVDMDDDEMTKGHAEAVLESLENWQMKQLFALRTENENVMSRLTLEGRLRGLDVSLDAATEIPGKQRIEEVE